MKPKPWHVFTTGTHTDNQNRTWSFDRKSLENISQTIIGRPVQIGHKNGIIKTKVKEAGVIGDHLFVVPEDVPSDLEEQVKGFGLSIQLFQPDHPQNPTPGQWSADHLAFVESPKIRDLLQPAFGEDGVIFDSQPIQLDKKKESISPDFKDLEISKLKSQIIEMQNRQWLEQVAFGSDGFRLPPHLKDITLSLMDVLGQVSEPVAFGDNLKSALDLFKDLIKNLPLAVSFGGEISAPESSQEPILLGFNIAPGYQVDHNKLDLYRKAKKYQLENPGVDLKTAYLAVGGS